MGNEVVFGIKLKADGSGFAGELRVSEEGMKRFARSAKDAGEQAGKSFGAASQGIRSISQQLASLQRFTTGFTGFAVMGVGVKEMVSGLFNAGVTSEKLFNTLKFGTGSAQAAAREMDYVRRTANELGLDLNTSAQAYAKLSAAANGTTLSGQATRDIFTSVSKAATVMGLSAGETQGALLAIGQMMSKGTVAAEELRGQLGERLPGAFQIAARAMGVTTAELGKMLESGEVMASTFLPRFAAELEKTLGNAPESAAQSAQSQLNRLNSEWTVFKENLANSGFLDVAAGGLKHLAGMFKSLDFSDRAKRDDLWARAERYQKEGYQQAYIETLREINRLDAEMDARRKSRESSGTSSDTSYADKEARRAAAVLAGQDRTALTSYLGDDKRMSRAEVLGKSVEAENKAFRLATVNLERNSAEYRQAWARHQQALTNLREKHNKDQKSLPELLGELSGVGRDFNKDLAMLKADYDGGRRSIDEYRAAVERLIKKQPFAREQHQLAIESARAHNKEVERELDLEEKQRQAVEQAIGGTRKLIEEMEFENTLIGLTNEARERAIALHELEARKTEMTADAYDKLRARMEAALDERETRGKAAAKAKEMQEESKRASENIRRDLTDALMRGFEDGKGGARNLRDTVKNYFRTLVLEPVIRPIVEPWAQAASGIGSGLAKAIAEALGGGGGWSDSQFAAQAAAEAAIPLEAFGGYHRGGIAGSEPTFTRMLPAASFAAAPRLHGGGIAGNEVPTILRRGEGVFTEGQMRALGGAQSVRVEIVNKGAEKRVVEAQPSFDAKGMVVSLLLEDLAENGRMSQGIASKFGLSGGAKF